MTADTTTAYLEKRVKDLENSLAGYRSVKTEQQMILEALELVNEKTTRKALIHGLLLWMKKWSECEAVGIRLKEGDDFPYYETKGFPDQFVKLERTLCIYNADGTIEKDSLGRPELECMCGNILYGRFDPSKNFFTKDGSFWSNATTRLLAETTDTDRQTRTRNRCNGFGYESVALIPLRSAGETFGLLQFNDHQEGKFTPPKIALYRRAADHVAAFLLKAQTRQALEKSESALKQAQKIAGLGSWQWDISTGRHTWSEEIYRIYGRDLNLPPAVYPEVKTYFTQESWNMLAQKVDNCRFKGLPYACDAEVVRPDGHHRWVIARGKAVQNASGQVIAMQGTVQDITDRKKAEFALKLSEERFKFLSGSTIEGIHIHDNGVVLDANQSLARMLGYTSADEIIGKQIMARHLTPVSLKTVQKMIATGFEGRYEVTGITCDGLRFPAELISKATTYHGRSARVTAARDITEQKQTEKLLQWNAQRNALLSETASKLLGSSDPQHLIQDICEKVMAFTGCQVFTNLLKDPESGVLRLNAFAGIPRDRANEIEAFGCEDRLCKRVSRLRQPVVIKDLQTRADPMTEFLRSMNVQAYMGIPLLMEDRLMGTLAFGKKMASRFEPGDIDVIESVAKLMAVAVNRIESQRIQDELETQLRQAQKVEAIGNLAGGVAHDLNNLLSPILGFGQMLQEDISPSDSRREGVDEIVNAGLRARDLVRQLLAFSRKQVLDVSPVHMNQIVQGLEKLLKRTIAENIRFRTNLSLDLPCVMADIGQVEQILMNLCVNAADAMPDGGDLTIETAEANLDAAYAAEHSDVTPGRYILLCVSDTGTGMDDKTLTSIFEPFFSTKGEQGTGMGLATVHGIVKQHGGHIWVYSEKRMGTTFKIYLPAISDDDQAPVPDRQHRAKTREGNETILLVEDNDQVRYLGRKILERQGYTVLGTESGEKALALLSHHNGPVHLLFTDVVMHGMNGRQLYQKALALHPGLKVLFMSGYTDDIIAHQGVLEKGLWFIQKPFTREDLSAKVRDVLDSPQTIPG